MGELLYILLNRLDTHLGHFPGTYWLLHNTGYIEMLGCECTRVPCFRWALGCLPLAAACPAASPVLVLLSLSRAPGLSRLCYDQHAPVLPLDTTALTRDKWIHSEPSLSSWLNWSTLWEEMKRDSTVWGVAVYPLNIPLRLECGRVWANLEDMW